MTNSEPKPLLNNIQRVNQRLNTLGINIQIHPQTLLNLINHHSEEKIRRALSEADKNPAALDFLNKVLKIVADSPADAENQNPNSTQTNSLSPQTDKSPVTQNKDYRSHHIYGKKSAACINCDSTKSGHPTLSIDGALSIGPQKYDWKNKIRLQLTAQEIPIFSAVVFGVIKTANFSNHNGKSLKITHQNSNLFIQLTMKDNGSRNVPCFVSDAYYLGGLCIKQLKAAQPWLDSSDIHVLINRVVGNMQNSQT